MKCFKKPEPLLEDRKQYVRECHRCGEYYRTFCKYSWFCDKCKKRGKNTEVPKDLNSPLYKKWKKDKDG